MKNANITQSFDKSTIIKIADPIVIKLLKPQDIYSKELQIVETSKSSMCKISDIYNTGPTIMNPPFCISNI